MQELLWRPSSEWETQPLKRRRVTIEELEQDLLRLSLSGGARDHLELDVLLQTLTLKSPSVMSTSGHAAAAQNEILPWESTDYVHGSTAEDDRAAKDCTGTHVDEQCTQIVPLRRMSHQRRTRRIVTIPRPLVSIAKFAVDSEGTAFVLAGNLRLQLARARDQRKRHHAASFAEDQEQLATAAVVINGVYGKAINHAAASIIIYDKPRKHDLVDDFMGLGL